MLLCATGLLFSTLLPKPGRDRHWCDLTGLLTATRFGWGGVARLFNAAIGEVSAVETLWSGAGEALLAVAVLVGVATAMFARKDLKPI